MTRNGSEMPRCFHIWVDGTLRAGFADGLDGVEQFDVDGETVLRGRYRDDAHLQGTLDRLRGLAIGIRRLEVDRPAAHAPHTPGDGT